jgi:hypothetical protein
MAGGGVAALGVKQERAAQYKGRMTWYVGMTCLVACVGGAIFGYDIGISGTNPLPGFLLAFDSVPALPLLRLPLLSRCRGACPITGDPDPDVALGNICCSVPTSNDTSKGWAAHTERSRTTQQQEMSDAAGTAHAMSKSLFSHFLTRGWNEWATTVRVKTKPGNKVASLKSRHHHMQRPVEFSETELF